VLLPDDLMVDDGELLRSMLDIHERYGRSVMALLQVSDEEISSYGCAAGEEVHEGLIEVKSIVEKPSPAEAPSNLAVFGRYVFTPEIFDSLDGIETGRGGELQLTDAISRLLEDQSVYGRLFVEGRHDIGQKLGFLRANVELALERPDLAADVADMLREVMLKYNL
jgi:UTP--glucose-1-phosphate uridylyltransferase